MHEYIERLMSEESREDTIELIKKMGTPLISTIENNENDVLLTMIYFGDETTESVTVFGEIFQDDEKDQLVRIEGSDIWYRDYIVANNTRSLYVFIINDDDSIDISGNDVRVDPYNPCISSIAEDKLFPEEGCVLFDEESMIEMPEFEGPEWLQDEVHIYDKIELSPIDGRRIWSYNSENGSDNKELLVFLDGFEYLFETKALLAINALMTRHKNLSIEALFVDSRPDRMDEFTVNGDYDQWIRDLVISKGYTRATIVGFSLGGLVAFRLMKKYPDIFGQVLCQSGALYYMDEEDEHAVAIVDDFEEMDISDKSAYLSIGKLEGEYPDHYKANQDMYQVLKDKGFKVTLEEHPCGHTSYDAQLTLLEGLEFLLI